MSETSDTLVNPTGPVVVKKLQSSVPEALAMLAAMDLGVFSHLTGDPQPSAALASTLNVDEGRLERLLYALTVCGLVIHNERGFRNSPEAATYLDRNSSFYIGDIHRFLREIWSADFHSAHSIRSGIPAAPLNFETASDSDLSKMLHAMHPNAVRAGRDMLGTYDFSWCKSIIDIGGGSGGLVATLCEANPSTRGTLLELPRTATHARSILSVTPGGHHVTVEEGDIVKRPADGTHEVAILRALIQTLPKADAARAIANAAASLDVGGLMYIIGSGILDDSRVSPHSAVFMNLTFLNLYQGGAAYTEAEHASWLADAGCKLRERRYLHNGGIICAEKLKG